MNSAASSIGRDRSPWCSRGRPRVVPSLAEPVPQVREPLRVPADLQPVSDHVEGPARNPALPDVTTDGREVATVELHEAIAGLPAESVLVDLTVVPVADREEVAAPTPP